MKNRELQALGQQAEQHGLELIERGLRGQIQRWRLTGQLYDAATALVQAE